MSPSPQAIGPDWPSQHASPLSMNTSLVRWSGQKAPLWPGDPTQGFYMRHAQVLYSLRDFAMDDAGAQGKVTAEDTARWWR